MRRPRIIYWTTSCLEPEIEAVSKEIFALADHFRPSLIFGVSHHYSIRVSVKDRYIGFNTKFYPFLRLLIPLLERWADINHVYGEISPWLYYKALRKKPIVLTIASEKGVLVKEFLERCHAIIVQTQRMEERLLDAGIPQDKIRLIYPGVDLKKFKPVECPPPLDKPKILFATAPRTKEELETRGVYFLVEVAKLNPNISFTFLFRKWASGYTSLSATKKLIEKYKLRNIKILNAAIRDMSKIYQEHHFTIIPYTTPDGGKECPNSLIESLACGVPVLISGSASFGDFIKAHECGIVFNLEISAFGEMIKKGLRQYNRLHGNSKNIARLFFSYKKQVDSIMNIYTCIC